MRALELIAGFFRSRWQVLRGRGAETGASAPEWAYITAAGLALAGLIYAAVQSGVAEKISQIKGS